MPKDLDSYRPRILLLDDQQSFHVSFKLQFELDYDIESALNLEVALKYLKQKHYDLLLLDLKLEGDSSYKEGLERIPGLKEQFPDLPIIVITAHRDEDEVLIQSIKRGAVDFIDKKKPEFLDKK